MGVCNQVTFLILNYTASRLVPLLKVIDAPIQIPNIVNLAVSLYYDRIKFVDFETNSKLSLLLLLLLRWRYNAGWALASFTIRLQASRSLAPSLHSFIPIFLRSVDTSSSHLIFGLPLRSCKLSLTEH